MSSLYILLLFINSFLLEELVKFSVVMKSVVLVNLHTHFSSLCSVFFSCELSNAKAILFVQIFWRCSPFTYGRMFHRYVFHMLPCKTRQKQRIVVKIEKLLNLAGSSHHMLCCSSPKREGSEWEVLSGLQWVWTQCFGHKRTVRKETLRLQQQAHQISFQSLIVVAVWSSFYKAHKPLIAHKFIKITVIV